MEQHPIPQQISSYQFKLVGDMALAQFGKTAGGVAGLLISGYLSTKMQPLQVWGVTGIWLVLMVVVSKVMSKK